MWTILVGQKVDYFLYYGCDGGEGGEGEEGGGKRLRNCLIYITLLGSYIFDIEIYQIIHK